MLGGEWNIFCLPPMPAGVSTNRSRRGVVVRSVQLHSARGHYWSRASDDLCVGQPSRAVDWKCADRVTHMRRSSRFRCMGSVVKTGTKPACYLLAAERAIHRQILKRTVWAQDL